jgi:2,3,4,5-tetrahydropyridine-2-carboxylate N-succinyltransferase
MLSADRQYSCSFPRLSAVVDVDTSPPLPHVPDGDWAFDHRDKSMNTEQLQAVVDAAWEKRDTVGTGTRGEIRDAVEAALDGLDKGELRVAEKQGGQWHTHQWLKKAVLLSFRLNDSVLIPGGGRFEGAGEAAWYDKVRSKFAGWDADRFKAAGFRAVPTCVVRRSAYIAPGVVLMPCFVNVGARIDSGTMLDTWVTISSCAQIGKNCHISGGTGIGGVLEPLQAGPVIIEDNCFIGARAEVVEGVIVEEGCVLSMGVFIGASTKIIDRATGQVHYGRVPAYSVVVSGTLPDKPLPDGSPGPGLYCAVIVKRVDEKTRAKTSINELLRD